MPIMTKANPPEADKKEYEILDPHCREISGQQLYAGQKRIWLWEIEARFFIANGSIAVVPTEAPNA